MKNILKIIILLILIASNNLLFATTVISGPDIEQGLEIYSLWTPTYYDPIFTLSTDTQTIYYSDNSISYESEDFNLSNPGQTEMFYLDVYSNHYYWTKRYNLYIYFSDQFHPTTTETTYPQIDIEYNSEINNTSYWGNLKYIKLRNNFPKSDTISYNGRIVDATVYKYRIRVHSGIVDEELIRFYFSWDGYTQTVNQYWDMEGYVRVEIESL